MYAMIIGYSLQLLNRFLNAVSTERRLQKRRLKLVDEVTDAQIMGDVDALRRARGEIEYIDKRLARNDY